MNLSDDLTPAADPTPLLRAIRRRRHVRLATRAAFSTTAVLLAVIVFWRGEKPGPTEAAPAPLSEPPRESVAMTREEFIESLKDETFALIQWPDGREQLLIRR